ncbi:bone morphogenetic protein 10-like [Hoplias malabaricus]|uniref:bone morphogenetic protein 10-like n=1 Tax=Hoplias malabaricus TaxID=27720 RepID=UPI0034634609
MAVTQWSINLCFLLLLLHWCQSSPIPSLEELRSLSGTTRPVDRSLLDRENSTDVHELLGQFLYMLNLTEQGLAPRPQASRVKPPEYMMDLYNHYDKDRSTMPAANIIRSFKNEDSSPHSVTRRGVRTYSLLFNVSVPRQEHIIAAELRLYMLVPRDPRRHDGVDWKAAVFEMEMDDGPPFWKKSEVEEGGERDDVLTGMQELASRHGHRKESGWEVFALTDAVRRWIKSESMSHWLELHLESGSQMRDEDEVHGTILTELDLDKDKHEPVLIVFSDREGGSHQEKLREKPRHSTERTTEEPPDSNVLWMSEKDSEKQQDEALLMQMRSNVIHDNVPRTRRNAKGNHCERTSLYVEFKDIGWDSWILAPTGFEAYTCRGTCSYPMAPQVSPTKHAMIQALLNLRSPQKHPKPCCVPTKLEPISLLYINDNGNVFFEPKYEGMVVAECGCR